MKLLRGLVRLVALPVKLVLAVVGLAFRVGWWFGRLPVVASARVTRVLGSKGVIGIVIGGTIVALVTPFAGRELRDRLRRQLQPAAASDDEVSARVSFELAHAPRTWHLDQPQVTVSAGVARLAGQVPDADARLELTRVAATIPGVRSVDDALVVADTASGSDAANDDTDAR
jgi:osmotically-inducible protein OsmY